MAVRSVLITGATGGAGGAVVDAFRAAGWRIVAPVRSAGGLPQDVTDVPGVDLTDAAAVARAVDVAASDSAAPLRAVVNLVGGYGGGTKLHETAPDDFEAQFTLNLRPTFLVTRASLPHLVAAGAGSVVCVSTKGVVQPYPKAAGYLAAKAAVLTFAQAVAAEYKDAGVRCNALLPSVIDTAANRAAQPTADYSRWVSPEEFAAAVLFLASDESSALTGAAIPLYGRV